MKLAAQYYMRIALTRCYAHIVLKIVNETPRPKGEVSSRSDPDVNATSSGN